MIKLLLTTLIALSLMTSQVSATVYWVEDGVTGGTGSGTWADPWNPDDVILTANPKTLVTNDAVGFKTDGSSTHTATVSWQLPVQMNLFSADTGAASEAAALADGTPLLFPIDASGIGGTFLALNFKSSARGLWIKDPSLGILIGAAADRTTVQHNKVTGAANTPIQSPNNADSVNISHNHLQGAIRCIYTLDSSDPATIVGNYCELTSNGTGIQTADGFVHDNMIVIPSGVGNSVGIRHTATEGSVSHNTVVWRGAGTGVTIQGTIGITVSNPTVDVSHNIVQGVKSSGTTGYGITSTTASSNVTGSGNVVWDCDQATLNVPNLGYTDTLDPELAGGATVGEYDPTPGADLSGIATMPDRLGAPGYVQPGVIGKGASGGGVFFAHPIDHGK